MEAPEEKKRVGRYAGIVLLWSLLVVASKFLPVYFSGWGYAAHFSFITAFLPLIGALISFRWAFPLGVAAWYGTHWGQFFPLTGGIPTFLSLCSWRASRAPGSLGDQIVHRFIPLVCFALFILSPVGRGAWPYALYWGIPLALSFSSRQGFMGGLARAFQSTFTAHAIGSVIWLYFHPLSSLQWIALIPVVAFERCLLALVGWGGLLWLEKRRGVALSEESVTRSI